MLLESKLSASKNRNDEKTAQEEKRKSTHNLSKKNDQDKYQIYYDFRAGVPSLKSYQVYFRYSRVKLEIRGKFCLHFLRGCIETINVLLFTEKFG